jgi:hypothetical protein
MSFMKRLVFPAICLRPVLPQLLKIQGGEAMGREIEVKCMNVVGTDAEVVAEDMEVVVALMLGVITKVKAADCPVERITLGVRSITC